MLHSSKSASSRASEPPPASSSADVDPPADAASTSSTHARYSFRSRKKAPAVPPAPPKATRKRAKPAAPAKKAARKPRRAASSSSSETEESVPRKAPKRSSSAAAEEGDSGRTGNCAGASCLLGAPGRTAAVHPESAMAAEDGAAGDRDMEMGRLQQMLEARGLPSHILGALGPRIGGLLSRGPGPGAKLNGLIQAMTKDGDETAQLTAVIELCNLLVMGNEETLGNHFPVKEVVKALLKLMQLEHNFDIMIQAVRGITYLMEALPRCTPMVVEAIPQLIQRLDRMECMDVAEQALAALETLSKRHAKAVLMAGGLKACLAFLDFFSSVPQRTALSIAANCASQVGADELALVLPSLPLLSERLRTSDKKSVESVCAFFTRLVDNLAPAHPHTLTSVTANSLLPNLQNLLVVSPAVISTGVFMSLLRMLHLLCAYNSAIAVELHQNKIGDTLVHLLVSAKEDAKAGEMDLVTRSAQELHELVILIGELMPRLPLDGSSVFSVQSLLRREPSVAEAVVWSWKDDGSHWRAYTAIDSRILEAAYQSRETEVSLQASGNTYTVDLENMMQINDDTGTSRPLQRRVTPLQPVGGPANLRSGAAKAEAQDARLGIDRAVLDEFVRKLFPVLYEVYASTAGPGIRQDCLGSMLRMVFHSSPDLLRDVLKNLSVSSHIANMLSSTDLKIVVGALQLVRILLDKVPDVFTTYFRREGVMHQVEKLMKAPPPSPAAAASLAGSKSASEPVLPVAPPAQHPFLIGLPPGSAAGPTPLYGLLPTTNPPQASTPSVPTPGVAFGGLMEGFGAACRFGSVPGELGATPSSWIASQAQDPAGAVPIIPSPAFSDPLSMTSVVLPPPGLAPPPPPPPDEAEMKDTKGPETPETRRKESRQGKRRAAPSAGEQRTAGKLRHERNNNEGAKATLRTLRRGATEGSSTSSTRKSSFGSSSGAMTTRSRAKGPAPVPASLKAASSASRRSASNEPMAVGAVPAKAPAKRSGGFLADKLSSLPLPRWARTNSSASAAAALAAAPAPDRSRDAESSRLSAAMLSFHHPSAHHSSSSAYAAHLVNSIHHSANKDKVRQWIRQQASELMESFFVTGEGEESGNAILSRLAKYAAELECGDVDLGTKPLESLEATVVDSDVSSFEILHSGIIPALHRYLTAPDPSPLSTADQPSSFAVTRAKRLKRFLKVFLNIQEEKEKGRRRISLGDGEKEPALVRLVSKLGACLNQVEQFPVKVHDLPGSVGGHGTGLRGTSALRFFHTHQIKCILRRHPGSKDLRDWHRGPIKVDPLAQMSAIERYMIMKGYGRVRTQAEAGPDADGGGSSSEDGASDEEFEETLALGGLLGAHRIQFLINERILPYEMTLYQAVRQYGNPGGAGVDTDTDNEMSSLSYASIWVNTHTLWYRLAPDQAKDGTPTKGAAKKDLALSNNPGEAQNRPEGGKKKAAASISSKDRKASKSSDLLWTDGVIPPRVNPLSDFLERKVAICDDACNDVLALLRVLYGINRYWWAIFKTEEQTMKLFGPVVSTAEFVSGKLSGKVTRQLQDPLTVLSQQVPTWIRSLASVCPFVLSFESRQCVFYTSAFDRDRALQRLMDSLPEMGGAAEAADGQRVAPRLERRKVCIQREDLLKQAEAVLNSMDGSNRAVLEVQYQNEEGTGLGPTLEFYALVSKELQKARLLLWKDAGPAGQEEDALVSAAHGLYPQSVSRVMKQATVGKVRAKFQFIGRLLARALTDSRMVDLPLSPVLYKWLLGEERSLGLGDLWELDPTLLGSLQSLLVPDGGADEIDSLELDFTLPGSNPAAELRKGGKDMSVTGDNIADYVKLVTHWLLYEGVSRQMEALVEGFDSVLPVRHLRLFYPEEMEALFCGSPGTWDSPTLAAHIRPDHGFTHDSLPIHWLVEIMAAFSPEQQRSFLHFITGSPKLPVGGFKALTPPLTVVRKGCGEGEESGDGFLPSVMTCVNYLKLPAYSSKALMETRLATAINWGQNSFHLS